MRALTATSCHEGDSGTVEAVLEVALSTPVEDEVTVEYATADGTATAGEDYTATSGTLTIPAGATSGEVTVPVTGDTDQEGDEDLEVGLSNPTNAVLSDDTGVVTIEGDDAPEPDPSPSPSPSPSPGGDDGGSGSSEGAGEVVRSFGDDRLATAVQVSRDHWPGDGDGTSSGSGEAIVDEVLLATGFNYPDALAAGALAAELGVPLLLTEPDELPDVVATELSRLGPSRVIVLGGTAAVEQPVEDELVDAGYDVERVQGEDRYATAAAIATSVGAPASGEVALALGEHADPNRAWPDGLSAGSLAASPDRVPTLLTRADELPAAILDALEQLGAEQVVVLGGPAAVSDAVLDELTARGYTADRLWGQTRYGTSAAVAADALARADDGAVPVAFATGADFPDGLAGGALAARLQGVLLLIPPDDRARAEAVETFLREHADRLGSGVLIGGPDAVSDTVSQQLRGAMGQ